MQGHMKLTLCSSLSHLCGCSIFTLLKLTADSWQALDHETATRYGFPCDILPVISRTAKSCTSSTDQSRPGLEYHPNIHGIDYLVPQQ